MFHPEKGSKRRRHTKKTASIPHCAPSNASDKRFRFSNVKPFKRYLYLFPYNSHWRQRFRQFFSFKPKRVCVTYGVCVRVCGEIVNSIFFHFARDAHSRSRTIAHKLYATPLRRAHITLFCYFCLDSHPFNTIISFFLCRCCCFLDSTEQYRSMGSHSTTMTS